jgi:hypothetical protein
MAASAPTSPDNAHPRGEQATHPHPEQARDLRRERGGAHPQPLWRAGEQHGDRQHQHED